VTQHYKNYSGRRDGRFDTFQGNQNQIKINKKKGKLLWAFDQMLQCVLSPAASPDDRSGHEARSRGRGNVGI